MAKAKKLPSGQWRVLVYSHKDAQGKRKYESFTADTKKEAEYMAAEFAMNKANLKQSSSMTLTQAISLYIGSSDAVLSPTTIHGYKVIQQNSFQSLMDTPLKKLNTELLQIAVNEECKRKSRRHKNSVKTISSKTVINSYGLITAVINKYHPALNCTVRLPSKVNTIKELIPPEILLDLLRGTEIELPALLSMWLSFSMSEIKGLTKSKSLSNGYLSIEDVIVNVDGTEIKKKQAKTYTRTRKHKVPEYIQQLIDELPENQDVLVLLSGKTIYHKFTRLLKNSGLPHMTFHDLRHINASVMALLKIPEKYALERGGWKTDTVMKKVYTHTFSDERQIVDDTIDNYFNQKMQHEMQHEKEKA